MRKIISIFLLCVLFFPSASIIVIFPLQRLEIQHEVKQRLKTGVPPEELILFKLPYHENAGCGEIEWLSEHEFRYQDGFYDVVRVESHADTAWYYCLSDTKETQLFANLEALTTKAMQQSAEQKKRSSTLQRLLRSPLLAEHPPVHFFLNAHETLFPGYRFKLMTWYDSPAPPPPRA